MDLNANELVFIPLGGAEQFGANLNVYAYQGKILAVDMGMGFADEYYPGVDILLPDPQFLEDHKRDIAGLVITHAHEDHIGGVAHLWSRIKCPIFCTAFTAIILQKKLAENPECKGARIRIIKQHDPIDIGPFKTTFIPVTHSVPESSLLTIETELGQVVHSGDWNLDPKPIIGKPIDPETFKAIGKKGVLAYIGDSTNAGVNGFSGSESDVEKGLEQVFKECEQRVVVTMFASNIGRVVSICKAAEATDRHVAVIGRSLHRMIGAAKECGFMDGVKDMIDENDINLIPRDKLVIIATGSQGEPRAQIARIARGDQRNIKLQAGDTVVFSARPIPGNEKEINFVQNRLAGSSVNVINPRDTKHIIHVSGHPARDEIKQMYDWLKPQIVVPVHGEKVMIEDQAELARQSQIAQVVAPNNGSVIKLAPGKAEILDHVETGLLAVEPGRIISASHVAISERRKLQFSGTVHASIVIDRNGNLMARPHLSLVGLIDEDDDEEKEFAEDLIDEVEDMVAGLKRSKLSDVEIAEKIRIGIRRDIFEVLRIKAKISVHLTRV
ncbi:MAG: ribonuclease J [Alphaproteobacteria bacterium]|nr:ribonuclease J [Alphaproteobacteria bacterium]